MEQLLLKGMEEDNISVEIAESQKIYGEDVNFGSLSSELQSLKTILNGDKPSHNHDIVKTLKSRDRTTWLLIPSMIKVIKLSLVMAATSVIAERSFSSMRRLKTWLRFTMKQKRFNSIAILSTLQRSEITLFQDMSIVITISDILRRKICKICNIF